MVDLTDRDTSSACKNLDPVMYEASGRPYDHELDDTVCTNQVLVGSIQIILPVLLRFIIWRVSKCSDTYMSVQVAEHLKLVCALKPCWCCEICPNDTNIHLTVPLIQHLYVHPATHVRVSQKYE